MPTTTARTAPDFESLLSYQPPAGSLQDRVILITGAAAGIGRAVAEAAGALGAQIVALDRDKSALQDLGRVLTKRGAPEPVNEIMDLAQATLVDYRQLAERLRARWGRLDGLVNNAGVVGELAPFEHLEPDVWRQVMAVNLIAPFFITQWCLPVLRRARDPVLVFSLDHAQRAFWGGYGVAKAGAEALMHIVADEYHLGSNAPVRVFGVDTGPVMTPMRRQHYSGEPLNAHPAARDVVGPYLYALGKGAAGVSNVVWRSKAVPVRG